MVSTFKHSMLFAILALAPLSAEAKFFNCSFTEPFISVYAGTEVQVVTVITPHYSQSSNDERVEEAVTFTKNEVSVRSKGPITEVKAGPYTLIVDESRQGNNGMSDDEYPAEGTLTLSGTSLVGGCEVNDKRAVLPEGGAN